MHRVSKTSLLPLPTLQHLKHKSPPSTRRTNDYHLECSLDKENDQVQVDMLDHWTARSNQPSNKAKSRMLNTLFRHSISKKSSKVSDFAESSLLTEAKLYLMRLDGQLNRVHQVNYNSMYKNMEYCSGIYFTFYEDIVRELDRLISALSEKLKELQTCIVKKRSEHIRSIEMNNAYKYKISSVRESIEDKELELEPIFIALKNIEEAKVRVYKHCLMVGYDVRQEGLVWILKKLKYCPKLQEFPSFLTEKEISFIRSKYQRENSKIIKTEFLQVDQNGKTLGKTSDQIYELVTRKKKRQLSMIREGDIIDQLKQIHNQSYRSDKHRYINDDVLQMAEQSFPKTKCTKYQIIYKQTTKKLNRYCVNEIYKKSMKKKDKDIVEARRDSLNTLKILSHFDAKILDHLKQSSNCIVQTQEEKELDEIIRSLRYESYQEPSKYELTLRNPVSILCCLVGHQKAKRLVEQELSHLL